jgi:hypothetical protein
MLGMGARPYIAGALAIHYAGRAAELAGRARSLLPRDVAEALGDALSGAHAGGAGPSPLADGVLLDLAPPR